MRFEAEKQAINVRDVSIDENELRNARTGEQLFGAAGSTAPAMRL